MDESVKGFFDPKDFPSEADAGFNGCADDRIQSGTVSTTGEDADSHTRRHFS